MNQQATFSSTDLQPQLVLFDPSPQIEPRGTIVVMPGRGERAGVYERLGRRLAADGYPVRVTAEPTGDLTISLNQVASLLANPESVRPHVLIGSDTGSLVAVISALADPDAVDGVVLAGLPVTPQRGSDLSWEGELNARTACPVHRQRLSREELLRKGALAEAVPSAWIRRAHLGEIACPVLGLHGNEDEISPLELAREAYRLTATLELNAVIGGRHDVLNDKSHRSVAATLVLFLERLRSGPPIDPIVTLLDPRPFGGRPS